jgi:PAS domain S-box-containing protein
VVLGFVAIGTKALIRDTLGDPGYILLIAAVVIAAWLGGVRGGLAALAVTFVSDSLLYVTPGQLLASSGETFARQAIFMIVGLGTAVLIGTRRAARDRLADALDETAQLAQAIADRDQRLELVLEASGTGFWEWDMVTGRLDWSEAIYRQHGLDMAGPAPDFEDYLETIHPDDVVRFREAVATAIADGSHLDIEFRLCWPDGTVHWTRGSGRVFRDGAGRPVRMLGTGQDITERRLLEAERDRLFAEERRASRFREAFVDVISHELRTPITTVLGLTEILARPGRTDDPDARTALLNDVRAEAERLHRLVEDLLVLTRVERGRLEVEAEPLEPRRLLERVVAAEVPELPSIRISLDLEPHLPIVAGEATYVEQVLRNLLGNAAKYTRPGTRVVVSARAEMDGVAFRVTDAGPGLSADSLERIFELFYRDPERARSVAGSGIGLFVCASLVQAMGGRIWASSPAGGGSEFGFLLRVIEADDELPEAGPPTPAEAG